MSAITWRATTAERATDVLFLAALLSVSFKGMRWEIAGLSPQLADFLITAFLLAFLVERATSGARRPPRAVTIVLACAGGLALVYLGGATGIETRSGLEQFGKGLAYYVLHFAFLAAGVGHLISRSPRYYRAALACFLVGIGLNAGYAALQLLTAKLGVSIDAAVLSPITGRPARSLSYGLANGPDVLRARGLTLDPNHLGAMLLLPVLMLTAFSVRGVDLRWPRTRAALLGALGLVLVATLSRSALLGLAAGAVFLVVRYGRRLLTRPVVVPTAGVALILLSIVELNRGFYSRVLGARLDIRGEDRIQHLHAYEVLGPALTEHPVFGVGLNNYALTHAPRVDGRVEASLSYYVQVLVESGILGATVTALLLVYVFHGLHVLQRTARSTATLDARRLEVLASALTAALVATVVANAAYQTMSFSYFYALMTFAIAASAKGTSALRLRSQARDALRPRDRPTVAVLEGASIVP